MTENFRLNGIDQEAVYTLQHVVRHWCIIDAVAELMLLTIVQSKIGIDPAIWTRPTITATGAEFERAYLAANRVVELNAKRPVYVRVPGGEAIPMFGPSGGPMMAWLSVFYAPEPQSVPPREDPEIA